MAQNSKVPDPELVDKELMVLNYRRGGYTWDEIAQKTGYADASGAYLAYKRAIKRTMQQPADEIRQQEIDRVDRLQLAIWGKAMQGDIRAVLAIAKLMERRAKLLGLDKPIEIKQEVTTWDGSDAIDRAVRDLAALLAANSPDSAGESSMAVEESAFESITAGDELAQLVDSIGARVGEDEDRGGVDSLGSVDESQDPLGGNSEDLG